MTRIWHATSGEESDPLIVLVHGSMDRSAGLLKLGRRLDSRFEVLRYDRRGYGRSIDIAGPYAMPDQVADLTELLTERSRSRQATFVFGHSFGGNVALALADQHPELVTAVAVYESPLSWLDWWPGNSPGGTALSLGDPGDAAEAFLRRLMGDDSWERLSLPKRETRRAEGAAMVGELADLRQHEPWSTNRIDVPVLAMCGEHSKPHHQRATDLLPEVLADCRSEHIPGAGHFGPYSHPALVAERLVDFIESAG
jgi:pimeloyl-ACP methyl ester carboxylesterase